MDIVLLGAGGQAKDIIKNIEEYNMEVNRRKRINLLGCIDDISREKLNTKIASYPVFNSVKILSEKSFQSVFVLCAVGDPVNKKKFIKKIIKYHPRFCNIIHPSVKIPHTTELGIGVSIFALSVISSYCRIGNHVSINYLCSISHDCTIGSYVTLCPGVNLGGRVIIKESVFFGINSCCLNKLRINSWSVVGAGTTVTSDVPSCKIVVGNPQKTIGKREKNIPII